MIFIWEHAQLPSQVIQLQKRRQLLVNVHDELSAIATVGAGNVGSGGPPRRWRPPSAKKKTGRELNRGASC